MINYKRMVHLDIIRVILGESNCNQVTMTNFGFEGTKMGLELGFNCEFVSESGQHGAILGKLVRDGLEFHYTLMGGEFSIQLSGRRLEI